MNPYICLALKTVTIQNETKHLFKITNKQFQLRILQIHRMRYNLQIETTTQLQ